MATALRPKASAPGGEMDPLSESEPPRMPKISVVVPAKNEAKNLPFVFERMPRYVHEVILVDGQSTDDTVVVARTLWPTVRILHQATQGKGNALIQGFQAVTGDIVVMIDADGSTDPAAIPTYVDRLLAGWEFAKGSRFLPGGGSADITVVRRLGNWFLTRLVNGLYGTSYTDLCYGYNAFSSHVLQRLPLDCAGFDIETQMNIRVAKYGLRTVEVPSFEDRRMHGSSNLNAVSDGMKVLRMIYSEARKRALAGPADRGAADNGRSVWDGVERRSVGRRHSTGTSSEAQSIRSRRHLALAAGRRWLDAAVHVSTPANEPQDCSQLLTAAD